MSGITVCQSRLLGVLSVSTYSSWGLSSVSTYSQVPLYPGTHTRTNKKKSSCRHVFTIIYYRFCWYIKLPLVALKWTICSQNVFFLITWPMLRLSFTWIQERRSPGNSSVHATLCSVGVKIQESPPGWYTLKPQSSMVFTWFYSPDTACSVDAIFYITTIPPKYFSTPPCPKYCLIKLS